MIVCLRFEAPNKHADLDAKWIIYGKRHLSSKERQCLELWKESSSFLWPPGSKVIKGTRNTISYNPQYIARENPSVVYSWMSLQNSIRWALENRLLSTPKLTDRDIHHHETVAAPPPPPPPNSYLTQTFKDPFPGSQNRGYIRFWEIKK